MIKRTQYLTKVYGQPNGWKLDAYEREGGYTAAKKALGMTREALVDEAKKANIRGRGGAGFPAGIKWETVRTATADVKFVCCNADEGDSGTFADRMVMEGDPYMLIEGMSFLDAIFMTVTTMSTAFMQVSKFCA